MDDEGLLLSVVATSRNDDHGANLRRRMQTFVSAFIAQCQRHDFPAELILVEWNPPADRPRLADALRWPADPSPCQVRIIEVPPEMHNRLSHSQALPLFQMIAKNVGIRRARGRFVLATNIDVLFNDELMRFFKEGRLETGKVYRIDRTDVETDVPVDAPVEEQLAYCRSHQVRTNTAYGTFPLSPDGALVMGDDDVAEPNSGIVLSGGVSGVEYDAERKAFRWAGEEVLLLLNAPPGRPRRLLMELSPGPCVRRLPAELVVVKDRQVVARGQILGRSLVALTLPLVPGEREVLELRAVEGGHFPPPPPDCRVLDFAIHRARWSAEAVESAPPSPEDAFTVVATGAAVAGSAGSQNPGADVTCPAGGPRLEQGWHPLRSLGGLRCRWADSGASLLVGAGGGAGLSLRLWVGTGPNYKKRHKTTLQLRDGADRVLAETDLRRGPHAATLPLPARLAAPGRVFLHVLMDGAPLADGQGVRAFRLFGCARSDAPWGERLLGGARALLTGLGLFGRDAADRFRRRRRRRWMRRARGGAWAAGAEGRSRLPRLHTNACGDFTLMAREHWEQLRGYSEFEIFSMHLDSLFLYAAHVAGLEEAVLKPPMGVYHIEHSAGSGWTPEGEKDLFARVRKQGIPVMTIDELCDLVAEMRGQNDPALFNGTGWGLADQVLPEARVGRPGLPRAA
jgi:hypothetical protein